MNHFFPTKLSVVGFAAMLGSICILVATLFIGPTIYAEMGRSFSQPKILNSIAVVGFLGGMALYGLERRRRKR